MMAEWQWVLTEPDGTQLVELTTAKGRQVTWNLDDAATATWTMRGRSSQAKKIVPLATDLIIYRDGVKRFRGRVSSDGDTLDNTGHACTFTASDYRWALGQRDIWPGDTLAYNEDQATIVSALVAATQAKPGSNFGLVVPTVTTGVTRSRVFTIGASVGQTITTLGDTVNGFDWEVDPNLSLNIFHPARGTVAKEKLDWGGIVVKLTRASGTGYGNAIMTTGATNLVATDTASSFPPAGRWEQAYSDTDITDTPTLTTRAAFLLAFADQAPPTWQATLKPGWWSPDRLWLGDVAGLYVDSGRLQVDSAVRATQFQLTLGDDGGETVVATLGPCLVDRAGDTIPAGDSTGSALTETDLITAAPALVAPTLKTFLVGLNQRTAAALRQPT